MKKGIFSSFWPLALLMAVCIEQGKNVIYDIHKSRKGLLNSEAT